MELTILFEWDIPNNEDNDLNDEGTPQKLTNKWVFSLGYIDYNESRQLLIGDESKRETFFL
jgi:hypothetical protein